MKKLFSAILDDKYRNNVLIIFFLLSIGMIICLTWFKSQTLIDGPQHQLFDQHENLYNTVFAPGGGIKNLIPSYSLFFLIDMLWPISLLILVGHFYRMVINFIVKDTKNLSFIPKKINGILYDNKEDYLKVWFKRWKAVAIIALLLDWTENISYVFFPFLSSEDLPFLEIVAGLKTLLYVLACLIIPLFTFHLHSKFGIFHHIAEFFRTSYLSLIVIALIGFLMTFLSQGATIMIDILSSPVNLFFSFAFLNFLAILISHYPVYLFFKTNDKVFDTYKYNISEKKSLWGFGIISYVRHKKDGTPIPDWIKIAWHSLGLIMLLVWTSALCFALKNAFLPAFNIWNCFSLSFLILMVYYIDRRRSKSKLKKKIAAYRKQSNNYEDLLDEVRIFSLRFYRALSILIIYGLVLTICVGIFNWNWLINLSAIVLSILNAFVFLEFRLSRSFLKYNAFHSKNKESFKERRANKLSVLDFDEEFFNNETESKSWKKYLVRFSDNEYYLKSFRSLSLVALAYLALSNILIAHAWLLFNPINILVAFLILAYSVIIIYVKHLAYYNRKMHNSEMAPNDKMAGTAYAQQRVIQHSETKLDLDYDRKKYRFFHRRIPIFLFVLFILSSIVRTFADKNNQFKMVKKGDTISMSQFLSDFTKRNNVKNQPIMSIASDGGGLKANVWNLLVLKDKYDKAPNYFDNVLSLSGVSGGALGIGNFLPLITSESYEAKADEQIDKIGASNILAIDFAGVFMRDWVYSHLGIKNNDRSYHAMKVYEHHLGLGDLDQISFKAHWKKMYDSSRINIPLLNINSTSTTYKQGYALSVDHSNTFPASIDILNHPDDKSISYFNAISTTNRFPIASPAARIEGKGYFVDGGYFENSGILASEHIYNLALKESTQALRFDTMNYDHKILNIRNGKGDWARLFVKKFISQPDHEKLLKEINSTQENGAILQALVSLDKHPEVIRDRLKDKISFLAMPHLLTLNDIRAEVGGEIFVTAELIDAIKANNDAVHQALKDYDPDKHWWWGVVTPPLARLLTEPVVEYQRAMVASNFYEP